MTESEAVEKLTKFEAKAKLKELKGEEDEAN